jgi:putative protease
MVEEMGEVAKKEIGKVAHYYNKIGVAVIDLTDDLKVGDEIIIECEAGSIRQTVDSMQVEHESINEATSGQSIGLKVTGKVHENDKVYKVLE